MMRKQVKLQCEAKAKTGELWEVITVTEGLSENDAYYSAEVLKQDYKYLHGANSYLYQLGDGVFEHLPEEFQRNYNGVLGNVIGWFRNPRIVEGGEIKHEGFERGNKK